jgi:hypothetical protein
MSKIEKISTKNTAFRIVLPQKGIREGENLTSLVR